MMFVVLFVAFIILLVAYGFSCLSRYHSRREIRRMPRDIVHAKLSDGGRYDRDPYQPHRIVERPPLVTEQQVTPPPVHPGRCHCQHDDRWPL